MKRKVAGTKTMTLPVKGKKRKKAGKKAAKKSRTKRG